MISNNRWSEMICPDLGKWKDVNGKEHPIPPPGVEADDDDGYRVWCENQESEQQKHTEEDDSSLEGAE